mmetsp:Transcript_3107/g.5879  ORF Transcript_3107/g.5879 Transcript_3107/m.5879 type:complete len:155 (+) Transcript_3107:84-548(+)
MKRKTENEIGRHSAFLSIALVTFAMVDSQLNNAPAFIPRWCKFVLAVSFVTVGLNVYDKIASRQQVWVYKRARVPDLVLHLGEIMGGSLASLVVQTLMRHKCNGSYRQVQLGILGIQILLFLALSYAPQILGEHPFDRIVDTVYGGTEASVVIT